jgi:hypothetical protein
MAKLTLVPDLAPGDYLAAISAEDFVPPPSFINQTDASPQERRKSFHVVRNEEAEQCASR